MNEKLVWFDEPPRPTQPLSRERIVAAAVELADAQADGEITMRALAQKLGVRSPMALYRYVGSKDGLADLMADHAYGLITVPRGEGWRPALRALGLSAWAAVQAHPWFARLAFSRPPLGPNAMALYDAALAELDSLDLPAATRMGFVNTVFGHVFGSGLALLEERTMRAGIGGATDADLAEAARPYLERVAASGKYPYFTKWANDPARDETPPQTFETILEWLLDGLESG
ncbi:TetR/AcrR family transcriptional regulator [Amycolatopsis sp. 195334CR]|uniref:TetR/AcrR family transcriptional regulator n=1 Tax=Amycolatopsis sp. 195334CR TaxID=2814588 RepID=UPI001A90AB32|nr:TetR/AcrR family transcriptional regulator C-terminal domain-containing protein [Amycolatopsis sp. 195334CR]MBN6036872.1 TetR/AcrR family transcriptional regulator C-terminal domain-containing protein [Amycolatopsis sp. 195334CR]